MSYSASAATIIKISCSGSVGAGAISLPGLAVGDVIVQILPEGFNSGLETVVSVNNQLQQLSTLDWSTVNFTIYLLRGV